MPLARLDRADHEKTRRRSQRIEHLRGVWRQTPGWERIPDVGAMMQDGELR